MSYVFTYEVWKSFHKLQDIFQIPKYMYFETLGCMFNYILYMYTLQIGITQTTLWGITGSSRSLKRTWTWSCRWWCSTWRPPGSPSSVWGRCQRPWCHQLTPPYCRPAPCSLETSTSYCSDNRYRINLSKVTDWFCQTKCQEGSMAVATVRLYWSPLEFNTKM